MIETARLRLRRLAEADAPFILGLLTSRGFREGVGDRGVETLEDARRYLVEGALASHRDHGHGLDLVETHEGVSVGVCGLVRREGLAGPDLGYAFDAAVWGRGYASEAGAAVLEAAAAAGRGRIWAVVKPTNLASLAVLRRLGFVAAGDAGPPGARSLLFAWSRPGPGLGDAVALARS